MTSPNVVVADTVPAPARLGTPLLRPAEAAELLSVRPSWIYEAVRTNRLPCLRVGRHIRFTREMLEAWLANQERGT
jgi:excisionase family DNA binding protein